MISPDLIAELRATYFRSPTVLALLDEIERLRAVIRETHTDCAEWQAARYNPLRHAPHCKLYEIEP